jgi:hypothetical protein
MPDPSTPHDRTAFRILVTGSRTWDDKEFIWNVLDLALAELRDVTVVHGACPKGADAIAHGWVRHQLVNGGGEVRAERHPADWSTHGRAAGFRRNAEMVQLGADLCLAFVRDGSRGASNCADLAERAGIEVRRFEYYAHSSEEGVWPEGMYAP